jgi:hypothetical protein
MIEALGYIGIGTDKLEDWESFGSRWLGLQLAERTRSGLAFRMDDRKQRVFVGSPEQGVSTVFGWEVADAAALDRLAGHLESNGIAVSRLPRLWRTHSFQAVQSPASGLGRSAWATSCCALRASMK